MDRRSLTRFAWLSLAAALLTIGLKLTAWLLTGSVGLLSDALESLVHLIGALLALTMLTVAARPADDEHAYGHGKAEYFSSGVEGGLISLAALSIAAAAIRRLVDPQPLYHIGIGLTVSVLASMVNLATATVLLRVGRHRRSITLEANGAHLLTDVWNSIAVLAGVGAVVLTGWQRLDPLIALLVAANIIRTGVGIVSRSISGLMDCSLSASDKANVHAVLDRYRGEGLQFHALRTRQAGARRFVSLHVLVPGSWTVHEGHQLLERLEADIRHDLPHTTVFTHLESLDDPASWDDQTLERGQPGFEARGVQTH